jgi:mercuric ion binding protein
MILSGLLATFVGACNSSQAQKAETFKVWGNCEMCKSTIETSLKQEGIYSADWNVDTKIITLSYDSTRYTSAGLHKFIAAVGYDTDKLRGDDSAYNNLPGCCQYDRKP